MFGALGPCSLERWELVLGLGVGIQTRNLGFGIGCFLGRG